MAREQRDTGEFDRRIAVAEVGTGGLRRRLSATPAERAALSERYRILEINSLDADIEVIPERRDRYRLIATFTADVVQACVITLDPVASRVAERFEVVFAAEPGVPETGPEVVVEPTGEDPPEPIPDGRLAVGEMVAQHLALALDPYPRCSGAVLEPGEAGARAEQEGGESPFAILRKLG